MKRLYSMFFKGKQKQLAQEIDELKEQTSQKEKELQDLEVVSICDKRGTLYSFRKPIGFEVELLKVVDNFKEKGICAYISIIAHVKDENDSDLAICYGPSGNVFDNRFDDENRKSKYELIPIKIENIE